METMSLTTDNNSHSDRKHSSSKRVPSSLFFAIEGLYEKMLGYCPKDLHCEFQSEDILSIAMKDYLSPMEQVLLANGCASQVDTTRKVVEKLVHDELRSVVSQSLHRTIVGQTFDFDHATYNKNIQFVFSPISDSSSN